MSKTNYNQYKYFPHTNENIELMLEKIGVNNIDELFNDIPKEVLIDSLDLDNSLSEIELQKKVNKIASKNKLFEIYRGGGSYDVYTPSIIDYITSRQEFLTSYTPYQAEISQGTLQYIFEYQSMICELTGMDCANASMYDGASSCAEAILMACSQTRRKKALVSKTINKNYLEVIETYLKFKGIELEYVNEKDLVIDNDDLEKKITSDVACLICQYPNYYGYLENVKHINKLKQNKSLFIVCSDISTLSLINTPRELGADIACGDCQTLGVPLANGGPYIGYLACIESLVRKMPGRIVGMTTDKDGKRGYVLTLQAREQHIRREKATSNICSNQSLMALHVTIYAYLLGKKGLVSTQKLCYRNSHMLMDKLISTNKFMKVTEKPFIKEFVLKTNLDIDKLNEYLENKGYLGGINLGKGLCMFCATETKLEEEINEFVKIVGDYNE